MQCNHPSIRLLDESSEQPRLRFVIQKTACCDIHIYNLSLQILKIVYPSLDNSGRGD